MLKQLLVTFFACALISVTTLAQQTVVLVNSPASLEGSYDFTSAHTASPTWAADITMGVWTADAIVTISNGATQATNLGCDPLVNTDELKDKIAIVDRGSCNFSLKAYHAQKAGAKACVIVNSSGAPVGMAAGTMGDSITIPVVMISTQDGANIKDGIAQEPVNMTIGTIQYANDIGSSRTEIIRNPNGVTPDVQAKAGSTTMLPGAIINNRGDFDATNIVLSATINHTPAGGGSSTIVHNDAIGIDLLEVDSSIVVAMDIEYVSDAGKGKYTVDYAIEFDSTDNFLFDNTRSFDYFVSENVFTKAGWDAANNRPVSTLATTILNGGPIEILTGFHIPAGVGYNLDSVTFFAQADAAMSHTLGEEAGHITANVYEWNDMNEDGAVTADEITQVAIGPLGTLPNPNATSAWLTVRLLEMEDLEPIGYKIPANDLTYFVGIRYRGANTLSLGYDNSYNQTVYVDYIAPTVADLSYFLVNVWDGNTDLPDIAGDAGLFTGFRASSSTALFINPIVSSTGENNPEIGSFEVYPNPTTDFVNVETSFAKDYDKVDYTVVNSAGSVVAVISRDVKGHKDNVSVEVSHLPAGQYFLNVNTVDGSISKGFTVQR